MIEGNLKIANCIHHVICRLKSASIFEDCIFVEFLELHFIKSYKFIIQSENRIKCLETTNNISFSGLIDHLGFIEGL